jgi:hypothetical protein
MDDESRLFRLEEISAEARENLAELFIVLSRGMKKEGAGPQVVQAELDRFIELLFQESEAYRLALKLYAGRYKIIACKDVADIMREAIAKHMPDRKREESPEEDEIEGQASE